MNSSHSNPPRPIRQVLVANRGEVASRVFRTCRSAGIGTVAVFSDVDENLPFVSDADTAFRIGPAAPDASYLNQGRILAAAARAGADAIHPGYGFLAENAEFAEAVTAAGLVFIGPPASVIREMGSKQRAKEVAKRAGVPTVPGYNGEDQSFAALEAQTLKMGLPVMVKASAGGGGKGMRVVRDVNGLPEALQSARREAERAFGDGTLILEKYIEDGRHIEVQILGDTHGNIVHLFERECSIQRRHQKVVEEAPAPNLANALRKELLAAALRLAKELRYENAGTVEFMVKGDEFFFLEVNTRLQVEHAVTESITGLDLVAEQIRIAEGRPLGYMQADVVAHGAAIEARLYAEDPYNGFLPSSGTLLDWDVPTDLQVHSTVKAGTVVGIDYDPMLAKLVSGGPTRDEALRRMSASLARTFVPGLTTNLGLLRSIIDSEAFRDGNVDTGTLAQLVETPQATPDPWLAMVAVLLDSHERRRSFAPLPRVQSGYRNNRGDNQRLRFSVGEREHSLDYRAVSERTFEIARGDLSESVRLAKHSVGPRTSMVSFEAARGQRHVAKVASTATAVSGIQEHFVHIRGRDFRVIEGPRFPNVDSETMNGGMKAPMPGRVVSVAVQVGDAIEAGTTLVVIEAMKMEHTVKADRAGTISVLLVSKDDQVDAGQALLELKKE